MNPINERLERIESEETVILPNADGTTRTEKVKVPAWRDPKDGEIYLDAESVATLDRYKARRLGVLAPQELASLRERLGLAQSEMAELLQIGEKSWSRWETGREVVSRSLNLLILALYDGRVDLPWLRSKLANGGQPAPAPVVRSRGWEALVREERAVMWLQNRLLAGEDWSLALNLSEAWVTSTLLWNTRRSSKAPASEAPRPGGRSAQRAPKDTRIIEFPIAA